MIKPNSNSDIEDKIRSYFLKEYNVEISEADMPEVHQSLIHLGAAIARYVELQEEKHNTKTVRG